MRAEDFGCTRGPDRALRIGGASAPELAREFGTPFHVVDEARLRGRARSLRASFVARHCDVELFYAVKCNSVAAVAAALFDEGLGAEVTSPYELWLAQRLGVPGSKIVLNGPHKSDELLRAALAAEVGTIVIDALGEIERLERLAASCNAEPSVLLRVNPGFTPRGMNQGSATASRRGSVFGLDLRSGEIDAAFAELRRCRRVRYAGLHAHVGTGIRHPEDYAHAFRRLEPAFVAAQRAGFATRVFDFGGGFGVETSRELGTLEFLAYQGCGRLPKLAHAPLDFAPQLCDPLREFCARAGLPLPRLFLEPGRCLAGPAQHLLLTVHAVKERTGVGKFVITDGGAGTCAFPLYYELHEVLLANDLDAPREEAVTLVGPACFPSNWIYRRKRMPRLEAGDVLAVMDSGAYFLALEANFGFARTAVAMVSDGAARLVRRRESFEEMAARDEGILAAAIAEPG